MKNPQCKQIVIQFYYGLCRYIQDFRLQAPAAMLPFSYYKKSIYIAICMSTSCRLRRKSKFVWLKESKMRIRKIVGKSPIIYDINQIIDDFTAQLKLFLVFFFSLSKLVTTAYRLFITCYS